MPREKKYKWAFVSFEHDSYNSRMLAPLIKELEKEGHSINKPNVLSDHAYATKIDAETYLYSDIDEVLLVGEVPTVDRVIKGLKKYLHHLKMDVHQTYS